MTLFIYCLKSVAGDVFYVGITNNINKRLSCHISSARSGIKGGLFDKIRSLDFKVLIQKVDQVFIKSKKEEHVGRELETAWIHHYKTMGFKLTNKCQMSY